MEVRVPQLRSERSALEIRKTKQIEAKETQRQEVSLKVEGSPPVFVWELTPLKVMDGEEVKFVAKVQGLKTHQEIPFLVAIFSSTCDVIL